MKVQKLPKFGQQSRLLSFDIESNGLHGEAFAVGAVIVDAKGVVVETFVGRCEIEGQVDEWVQKNVLPVLKNIPVTHKSYGALRSAFWDWFTVAQKKTDYVVVSNGYPVEYGFLLACQHDAIDGRYWEHPFPILDATSVALGAHKDVSALKLRIAAELSGQAHNPVYDAQLAARMVLDVLLGA